MSPAQIPCALLLAVACRPAASAHVSNEPARSIAEPVHGSADDLVERGGHRAQASLAVTPTLPDRWLTMTVQTQGNDEGWWALGSGGKLRSGEVFVVEVRLESPAYVYIINIDSSERAVLLYPDAAHESDRRLDAGVHRLPPASSDYPHIELDDQVGTERIYVIASKVPIDDADRDVGSLVERLVGTPAQLPSAVTSSGARSSRGQKKRHTKRAQADDAARMLAAIEESMARANAAATPELSTRGTYRARASGAAIDAKAARDGVVVVPFELEHIQE